MFTLLYLYAYGKRRELELNAYEALRTRNDTINYAVVAGVGLLVAITAQLLPVGLCFFSLFLLCLSAAYGLLAKPVFRKQEKLALEQVQAASRTAAAS